VKRLLVVAPQGLGDSLEATPLVRALHAAEPEAAIDVAVMRPQARALFRGLDRLVARTIDLPYWERGSAAFAAAALANVRPFRYRAAFLAYPAARLEYQVLLALLAPGARRFAHRYFDPTWRNGLRLATDVVPVRAVHNVERNLDLLRAAGYAPAAPLAYEVPAAWRARGPRRLERVVVHAGTIVHDGLESRRWSPANFATLIERLRRRYDVVLLSGPSEREVTREIAAAAGDVPCFEGTLDDVAVFLAESRVVVANDSGIAHLAAGVGTPVLAVVGPTPVEHGPFGPGALAFRPTSCPPCFDPRYLNTSCALDIDYACLKRDATVDAVEAALERLLLATAPTGIASCAERSRAR
jgi:ADP-heptose:LPS heptosyltransferase